MKNSSTCPALLASSARTAATATQIRMPEERRNCAVISNVAYRADARTTLTARYPGPSSVFRRTGRARKDWVHSKFKVIFPSSLNHIQASTGKIPPPAMLPLNRKCLRRDKIYAKSHSPGRKVRCKPLCVEVRSPEPQQSKPAYTFSASFRHNPQPLAPASVQRPRQARNLTARFSSATHRSTRYTKWWTWYR